MGSKLHIAAAAVAGLFLTVPALPAAATIGIQPTIELSNPACTTSCANSVRTVLGSSPPSTAKIKLSYDYGTTAGSTELDYFLIEPVDTDNSNDPGAPKAILMLLEGGGGVVGVRDNELGIRASGFPTRQRWGFAAAGPYVIALVDAARFWIDGPGDLFEKRLTDKHMEDLANVIADLRNRFPGLPVWAVGMSRGTISAAASGSIRLDAAAKPDGLVLFSPVTKPSGAFPDRNWVWDGDGGDSVKAQTIDVPTVIISHQDDECPVSTPTGVRGAQALADLIATAPNPDVEAEKLLKGGYTAISDRCDALSAHGFFAKEAEAIAKMKNFIKDYLP